MAAAKTERRQRQNEIPDYTGPKKARLPQSGNESTAELEGATAKAPASDPWADYFGNAISGPARDTPSSLSGSKTSKASSAPPKSGSGAGPSSSASASPSPTPATTGEVEASEADVRASILEDWADASVMQYMEVQEVHRRVSHYREELTELVALSNEHLSALRTEAAINTIESQEFLERLELQSDEQTVWKELLDQHEPPPAPQPVTEYPRWGLETPGSGQRRQIMESQIRYVSGALTIEYAADFDREELNTEWHQLVDAWETEAEELKKRSAIDQEMWRTSPLQSEEANAIRASQESRRNRDTTPEAVSETQTSTAKAQPKSAPPPQARRESHSQLLEAAQLENAGRLQIQWDWLNGMAFLDVERRCDLKRRDVLQEWNAFVVDAWQQHGAIHRASLEELEDRHRDDSLKEWNAFVDEAWQQHGAMRRSALEQTESRQRGKVIWEYHAFEDGASQQHRELSRAALEDVESRRRFSLEQDQSNSVVAFAILAAEDMARQQIGSECRDAEEVLTARSSELGLMDVCAREETARQGLQRDWEAGAGDLQDRAGQLKLLLIEEEECADRERLGHASAREAESLDLQNQEKRDRCGILAAAEGIRKHMAALADKDLQTLTLTLALLQDEGAQRIAFAVQYAPVALGWGVESKELCDRHAIDTEQTEGHRRLQLEKYNELMLLLLLQKEEMVRQDIEHTCAIEAVALSIEGLETEGRVLIAEDRTSEVMGLMYSGSEFLHRKHIQYQELAAAERLQHTAARELVQVEEESARAAGLIEYLQGMRHISQEISEALVHRMSYGTYRQRSPRKQRQLPPPDNVVATVSPNTTPRALRVQRMTFMSRQIDRLEDMEREEREMIEGLEAVACPLRTSTGKHFRQKVRGAQSALRETQEKEAEERRAIQDTSLQIQEMLVQQCQTMMQDLTEDRDAAILKMQCAARSRLAHKRKEEVAARQSSGDLQDVPTSELASYNSKSVQGTKVLTLLDSADVVPAAAPAVPQPPPPETKARSRGSWRLRKN
uniref:Uncharacterized protein n=1 Tax=Eutreptiella gymnastica TaxID=73025 RepID=A0A7S4D397_9EUGL